MRSLNRWELASIGWPDTSAPAQSFGQSCMPTTIRGWQGASLVKKWKNGYSRSLLDGLANRVRYFSLWPNDLATEGPGGFSPTGAGCRAAQAPSLDLPCMAMSS